MKMIFQSHASETHDKKGFVLSLILKMRVFETQEWSIGYQWHAAAGLTLTGAHDPGRATSIYLGHSIFTNQFIFRKILAGI